LTTPSLTLLVVPRLIKRYKDEYFNSPVDDDSDGTDEHDAEDGNVEGYDGGIGSEGESEYGWTDDSRPQK
jgi:hypothetical protein